MLRVATYIGMAIAGFIVLYLITVFLGGSLSMFTAPFRGEVDKTEKVQADGDYRIAQYDWFFEQCSAIQSKQDQIQLLQVEANSTSDPDRKAQLEGSITAQRNVMVQLASEYNAKAASEGTKGQFKDSELPYNIDPMSEDVTCGS